MVTQSVASYSVPMVSSKAAEEQKAAPVSDNEDAASTTPTLPSIESLQQLLLNESAPIAARTRAIFLLKQIGSHEAIDVLASGLSSPSVLLSHEIAYVLGQLQDPYALKYLYETLENKTLDPITRHEAAEAIAAIGEEESLPILQQYSNDDSKEVRDTCQIAVDSVKHHIEHRKTAFLRMAAGELPAVSRFASVDPAPPFTEDLTILQLQDILCDRSQSLYQRYRAMFTLRNIAAKHIDAIEAGMSSDVSADEQHSVAAINAIVAGFDSEPFHQHSTEEGSAVFRHEIAYVLGQLAHPAATSALTSALKRSAEHAMTRHEAAEALGAIAGDGHDDEKINAVLTEHLKDGDVIVAESCEVGLDISAYWGSDQFDTAVKQENE